MEIIIGDEEVVEEEKEVKWNLQKVIMDWFVTKSGVNLSCSTLNQVMINSKMD